MGWNLKPHFHPPCKILVTLELLDHQGCCHSVLVILCFLLAVFAQGKVPFIHVGNQVVSELGPIIQFTKAKLYIQWCDETTAAEITRPRYSSPYPWPLKHILAYQKQWEVRRKMSAVGWAEKTLEQVYEDVAQCCQALSQRLGTQMYFFNRQPTELDALVFGHLFTILTTQLTSNELSDKVKTYSNLLTFVHRIEQTYFEGLNQAGQSGAGPWAPPEV
uniref:Metaxin 2 n=1 Tax=Paramormyrops kingsleyae TaxID=1676925 RepID=A0A3B3SZM8_9TELE